MTAVDVGDAFELTFATAPGATVTASWYDADLAPVFEDQAVTEVPDGSGLFPRVFVGTGPGFWRVLFTASGAATTQDEQWVRVRAVGGQPPLAVLGDVSALFGGMTAAQEGLTKYLLRAASALVRSRFPTVDAQVSSGVLNPDVVALAVTNMILRVLNNPNGLRAQTIGPFSYTYDTSVAAGLLVLGGDEEVVFTPVSTTATAAGAFGTVRIQAGMAPSARRRRRGW